MLPYSYISGVPNFALASQLSAYQPLITSTNQIPYSNVSGTPSLANFVTNASLSSTLCSYVTTSSLSTTLGAYVTTSSLTTTLNSYVTTTNLTTSLNLKANLASPTFTGTVTAQALTVNDGAYVTGNLTTQGNFLSNAIACTDINSSGQLYVTGFKASSATAKGVLIGVESSGNAAIEIISDAGKISYLDFSTPLTDTKGRIMYDNSLNTMTFYTNASLTVRMTIQSNGTVNIPTLTGTSKSFDIPHVQKGGAWRLRHRVVEGEKAQNLYRYSLDLTVGETSMTLPEYNRFLNTNYQVFVSPKGHFGIGYGDVAVGESEISLVVNVNQAGMYNILVIADRNDSGAVDEYTSYGVEYEEQP